MRFATEDPSRTEEVLALIGDERERQFAKWGPQHHPDGSGYASIVDVVGMQFTPATLREWFRDLCDAHAREGRVTWLDILLEETFEAASESDLTALAKELEQVAAVAVAWREDILSRG